MQAELPAPLFTRVRGTRILGSSTGLGLLLPWECNRSGGGRGKGADCMRRLVFVLTVMVAALFMASGVALAVTKIGTSGPDTLTGTNNSDTLVGNGGDDTLFSRAGNDTL